MLEIKRFFNKLKVQQTKTKEKEPKPLYLLELQQNALQLSLFSWGSTKTPTMETAEEQTVLHWPAQNMWQNKSRGPECRGLQPLTL